MVNGDAWHGSCSLRFESIPGGAGGRFMRGRPPAFLCLHFLRAVERFIGEGAGPSPRNFPIDTLPTSWYGYSANVGGPSPQRSFGHQISLRKVDPTGEPVGFLVPSGNRREPQLNRGASTQDAPKTAQKPTIGVGFCVSGAVRPAASSPELQSLETTEVGGITPTSRMKAVTASRKASGSSKNGK